MTLEADPSTQPRSRRNLLAVAGAGAAAAIATLVSGNRARAGHGVVDDADVLHLGRQNAAEGTTALITGGLPSSLYVRNNGGGDALELESTGQVMVARLLGDSTNHTVQVEHDGVGGGAAVFARGFNTGVQGEARGDGSGVSGSSESGPGALGESGSGPGVAGQSETGPGVTGHSQSSIGVNGNSHTGPGVAGTSESGSGVAGFSPNRGVHGSSNVGTGVEGDSVEGIGVRGVSGTGDGVSGQSDGGAGVNGHSHSGPGGTFSTEDGVSVVGISGHASSFALGVDNAASGEEAGGILVNTRGGKPTIEGDAFPFDEDHRGVGVQGVSYSGTSYQDGGFGEGPGIGVEGLSGTGLGVHGRSQSGTGVSGHSQSGTGGTFHTDSGDFAANIGGNAVEFALGVDNALAGDRAGGILSTSRGGKPAIEADVFPLDDDNPGVAVQGVAYLGSDYDDGAFGEGPGTGVQGISGTGRGVHGQSASHFGVHGESGGGFPGGVGVFGFSQGDVGVFGVSSQDGDGDGVGGFSEKSVGGRFASANGIGVRAVSPGEDHPALQAASGVVHADPHFEAEPDGGLALEVIGKARFSTAGSASVPQGENSVFVANSAVTADSHITVTLTSDPGSRQLLWVRRSPGSGFTVHLTSAPPPHRLATDFTYLIVEPGTG